MSAEEAQRAIVAALEARREEVEAACCEHIDADGVSKDILDGEYVEGLSASIRKAFEHGLAAIAAGDGPAPETPAVLLTQARLAAQNGVELSVVQRRYMDCFNIFSEFVAEEAERLGSGGVGQFRRAHKSAKAAFGRLVDVVGTEYAQADASPAEPDRRRLALVEAHLAGMPVDTSELGYEFDSCHVALVAEGEAAASAIDVLAAELASQSLVQPLGQAKVLAWLGKPEGIGLAKLQELLGKCWPANATLGIGEAGRGKEGSRRTHRQARKAFAVANRLPERVFRYGDNPLLASAFADEDLVMHLGEAYLMRLREMRGGAEFLQTLRAYFAADRNGASAGHALNASRQTVSHRLRTIEEKLGFTFADRATEIEVAIMLERLEDEQL
jgi:PucR-like helix-turn-helix protein/diguanylate cyclase with GGDEF domain